MMTHALRAHRAGKAAILLAGLCAALPATAQESEFNLEDEVAYCTSCHGEDGIPIDQTYPIIWGQQYFYIYTQLRDYGAGRRQHEIMTDIAAAYDRDQAKALAEHFAGLTWPEIEAPEVSDEEARLAQSGITGGQCSACHGKWQGDSRIPRAAGQQPGYLDATMLAFKHEERMNAPDKISTMQQLSDDTIKALSRYLAATQIHGGT